MYTPFPPPQQPRKVSTLGGFETRVADTLVFPFFRWIYNWSLENTFSRLTKRRRAKQRSGKRRYGAVARGMIFCSSGFQQEEVTAERLAKRAEAFVAPEEEFAPTIEEKRKRKHVRDQDHSDGAEKAKKKKKKRAEEVENA